VKSKQFLKGECTVMGSWCACLLVLRTWVLKWAPDKSTSCECNIYLQHDCLEPYFSRYVEALCARTYLLISGAKWSNEKLIPRKQKFLTFQTYTNTSVAKTLSTAHSW
jgi:hypothetical protein